MIIIKETKMENRKKAFEEKLTEMFGRKFTMINSKAFSIEGSKDDDVIRVVGEKFGFKLKAMRGSSTDMDKSALRMVFVEA